MDRIDIMSEGQLIGSVFGGEDISGAATLLPDAQVFMVYDENVAGFAAALSAAVRDRFRRSVPVLPVHASEAEKTIETVSLICDWLLEEGASRDAVLMAVGGGIITDMVGFAASVYMRGIRFAFVPTTLLSQTDAAIGGKTGVNFKKYKNMLGVIRQSLFTYICPEPLVTLERREFLGGVSELLKTFIISNEGDRYGRVVRLLSSNEKGGVTNDFAAALHPFIMAAAAVKAIIVGRDQFESGERRKLNLGHTFAHAIEHCAAVRGDDISHGEAVSAGIILAATLSERFGMAAEGLAEGLEEDFRRIGLVTECPYPLEELAPAMTKDKKTEGGKVHFVLIKEIGDVRVVSMGVDEAVKLMNR